MKNHLLAQRVKLENIDNQVVVLFCSQV